MQTIDIARIFQKACSTAVDVYHAFFEDVNKRVIEAGFTGRVRTVQASMDALPFYPASFDVIWAEGSIFILGVERGITLLKKTHKIRWFYRVY
jgi:ubiquinone/menaquinone biosynthesis C-methylase UbiE